MAGNIVETRVARVPEVQRVSTLAGSEVYGGFTLKFNDEDTEQLPHNASAEEVNIVGTRQVVRDHFLFHTACAFCYFCLRVTRDLHPRRGWGFDRRDCWFRTQPACNVSASN